MKLFCAFCKLYAIVQEKDGVVTCRFKNQPVEPWYRACRDAFRDRRENRGYLTGNERRRDCKTIFDII